MSGLLHTVGRLRLKKEFSAFDPFFSLSRPCSSYTHEHAWRRSMLLQRCRLFSLTDAALENMIRAMASSDPVFFRKHLTSISQVVIIAKHV